MTSQKPPPPQPSLIAPPPVFVTGLSGAGISTVMKDLEDLGYEAFDNFPLNLIHDLLVQQSSGNRPLAFGLDTRTRGFDVADVITKTREENAALVFVTCDESVLQKRYSETRRRHPLAGDRPVSAGIKKEMALLYPLREHASLVVDTSTLTIHDLRRIITGHFSPAQQNTLTLTFLSFGFKHGLPRESDIVMDVRFLRNPHWDKRLKPLTGQDKTVQDFIALDADFAPFVTNFRAVLLPMIARYREEGRSYMTIAIGCTGGKHRSVYVAEQLAELLRKEAHIPITVEHRDIQRT